jgi:hypothetical protein
MSLTSIAAWVCSTQCLWMCNAAAWAVYEQWSARHQNVHVLLRSLHRFYTAFSANHMQLPVHILCNCLYIFYAVLCICICYRQQSERVLYSGWEINVAVYACFTQLYVHVLHNFTCMFYAAPYPKQPSRKFYAAAWKVYTQWHFLRRGLWWYSQRSLHFYTAAVLFLCSSCAISTQQLYMFYAAAVHVLRSSCISSLQKLYMIYAAAVHVLRGSCACSTQQLC